MTRDVRKGNSLEGHDGLRVESLEDVDGNLSTFGSEDLVLSVDHRQVLALGLADVNLGGRLERERVGNLDGEVVVDLVEVVDRSLLDTLVLALAELKLDGRDDVLLLDRVERVVEHGRLVEVLVELGRSLSGLDAVDGSLQGTKRGSQTRDLKKQKWKRTNGVGLEGSLRGRNDLGRVESVRAVVDRALVDDSGHLAVSDVAEDGADGSVDGQVFEVDSDSGDLGVEVREVSTLEEGVI